MSFKFLGIDTSNYTTSASLVCNGTVLYNVKLPVTVADGSRGVRQSDAVFAHVKNIADVIEKIGNIKELAALGYSAYPRDVKGSYMPCFLVGTATARSIASTRGIPAYPFSHQAGHIMAALYSAGNIELFEKKHIAFHVSGGTTEMLLCENSQITKIGGTLDLTAGQAIDRVGVMLGLKFPCGPALEKLASGVPAPKVKTCVNGFECNLSGIENKAGDLHASGASDAEVASYTIEAVRASLDCMASNVKKVYGDIPILFAGGVMSCRIVRNSLENKYGALFAEPEFSSDNAAGTALLCERKFMNDGR